MEPVLAFKPFCDYFASWLPGPVTDKDYVIAQYDGAIAYMDAAIQSIFTALDSHSDPGRHTIVVITADHGETLYEHECWFDHHGDLRQCAPCTADHQATRRGCLRVAAKASSRQPELGHHPDH
jgi:glucan phosphoethanolaminetransferase (alkaline phosphatase superfamily)